MQSIMSNTDAWPLASQHAYNLRHRKSNIFSATECANYFASRGYTVNPIPL